ncbi:MAG: hypothetical protein ABR953_15035, partial [Candidatus Acidiferrales bacterium]
AQAPNLRIAMGTCTLAQEGLPQASCTVLLPAGWSANYSVSLTSTNVNNSMYYYDGGELYVYYQSKNGFVVQSTNTIEDGRTLQWVAIDLPKK